MTLQFTTGLVRVLAIITAGATLCLTLALNGTVLYFTVLYSTALYFITIYLAVVFNRPGVAGAVLQTASSLIH